MSKILIIEDIESVHALLKYHLNKRGYIKDEIEIYSAFTWSVGKRLFELETPDVVIYDLTLSDTNVETSMENIRLLSEKSPVIVITGHDNPETARKCLENGAVNFIGKSEDISIIEKAVFCAIENKNQKRRLALKLAGNKLEDVSAILRKMIGE